MASHSGRARPDELASASGRAYRTTGEPYPVLRPLTVVTIGTIRDGTQARLSPMSYCALARATTRKGAIVKTCGSKIFLGSVGRAGAFDELAVDESRSGADQGDEVERIDGVPAVLR